MTFLLILLGMYVFIFAAFVSVKRSPFKATSTAFLDVDKNPLPIIETDYLLFHFKIKTCRYGRWTNKTGILKI
jgi:hypothetical protein